MHWKPEGLKYRYAYITGTCCIWLIPVCSRKLDGMIQHEGWGPGIFYLSQQRPVWRLQTELGICQWQFHLNDTALNLLNSLYRLYPNNSSDLIFWIVETEWCLLQMVDVMNISNIVILQDFLSHYCLTCLRHFGVIVGRYGPVDSVVVRDTGKRGEHLPAKTHIHTQSW